MYFDGNRRTAKARVVSQEQRVNDEILTNWLQFMFSDGHSIH